jgi:hypothetical protein
LDPALAKKVADQFMAHDAIAAHARDELGISERHKAQPIQAAFASAVSFSVGAALPLVVTRIDSAASLIVSGFRPRAGLPRAFGGGGGTRRQRADGAKHAPRDVLGHVGDGDHRGR